MNGLERQERVVLDVIRSAGADGATPADILARLDQIPSSKGKPRRNGRVYHKAPAQKVAVIRRKLGHSVIKTVVTDGTTRYFIGDS